MNSMEYKTFLRTLLRGSSTCGCCSFGLINMSKVAPTRPHLFKYASTHEHTRCRRHFHSTTLRWVLHGLYLSCSNGMALVDAFLLFPMTASRFVNNGLLDMTQFSSRVLDGNDGPHRIRRNRLRHVNSITFEGRYCRLITYKTDLNRAIFGEGCQVR